MCIRDSFDISDDVYPEGNLVRRNGNAAVHGYLRVQVGGNHSGLLHPDCRRTRPRSQVTKEAANMPHMWKNFQRRRSEGISRLNVIIIF